MEILQKMIQNCPSYPIVVEIRYLTDSSLPRLVVAVPNLFAIRFANLPSPKDMDQGSTISSFACSLFHVLLKPVKTGRLKYENYRKALTHS